MAWNMPADGELISTWCHFHGAEHVIIFKGDPNKFALGQKYKKKDIWTLKNVDNVDDVANELIQSAKEAGIGHCEGKIQWQGEDIRMTKFNCLPWKFKEGEIASMIALYDPVRRPYTNLRQHLIFRAEWLPEDPTIIERRPDLIYENSNFCGEDPHHCLSSISMGMKMYVAFVNRGFLPEYHPAKALLGWFMLLTLLALMSFGCFKLIMWLHRRLKRKTACFPNMKEELIEIPRFSEIISFTRDTQIQLENGSRVLCESKKDATLE